LLEPKWFQAKERDARYDYLYDDKELRGIAVTIKSLETKLVDRPDRTSSKKLAVAANNHFRGKAVANVWS
jgi:hypothetical protein